MDTLSIRNRRSAENNFCFDSDEDKREIILESTSGDYTRGDTYICDCCGDRYDQDTIHYSELEEEELCDDCCTYIEERGESCRTENAVYNSYSGEYHYNGDLDI